MDRQREVFLDRRQHQRGLGAVHAGDGADLLDQQAIERPRVLGADLQEVRIAAGDPVAFEDVGERQDPLAELLEVLGVRDPDADERRDVLAQVRRIDET